MVEFSDSFYSEKIIPNKYLFSNKREILVFNLFLEFQNEKDFRFFVSELSKNLQIRSQYKFHYQTKYFILLQFSKKISIKSNFKQFEKICTFFKTRYHQQILTHYRKFLFSFEIFVFPKVLPSTSFPLRNKMYPYFFLKRKIVKHLLLCFETEINLKYFLLKTKNIYFPEEFYPCLSVNAFEIEKSFFVLLLWKKKVILFPSLKPEMGAKFFTLQFAEKFLKTYSQQKYSEQINKQFIL